jgi:hypothetical protein
MVHTLYDIAPGYHIEVFLEFIFGIVTMVVSLMAYRIYKITNQKQSKFLSFSFFFISLGYFVQALFNLLILLELRKEISSLIMLVNRIYLFDRIGLSLHIFMMITGLVILLWMTLRSERTRTLWLLFILTMVSMYFSVNKLYMFFVLSSLYLAFISHHFIRNYLEKRQLPRLLVALAFASLFVARLHFLFIQNSILFYHIGHVIEMVAYTFIIINLALLKNDKKKR